MPLHLFYSLFMSCHELRVFDFQNLLDHFVMILKYLLLILNFKFDESIRLF